MMIRVVTVLGGTGFLGRRIVRHLRKRDFSVRVASRTSGTLSRTIRYRRALTFNQSKPMFAMNNQSLTPLLALRQ
jgi:nucleoside-diphosphate-sugar epimerase